MTRRKGRAITDTVGLAPISFPTGSVLAFAGTTAPTGWALCAGQTVSRTEFASIFNVIGTTYGAGDGSTTFVLPDYRGRVPVGMDNMGGVAANRMTTAGSGVDGTVLGAAGGAQTHTLSEAQLASHGHTQPAHNHASGYGLGDNAPYARYGSVETGAGASVYGGAGGSPTNAALSSSSAPNTNTQGGSQPHQNTQPSIICNYIIKL